jgi:Carboxypeptidase regulatory-like domain
MKKELTITRFISFVLLLFLFSVIHAQSGGDFTITQSVIANGGQPTSSGAFSLDGTVGQSLAGGSISNSPFEATSGFWNYSILPPTAATVTIGGRVMGANGNGIPNVRVRLNAPNGSIQTVLTGPFGYYRFENIAVGQTYVFSVFAKRLTFSQPTQILTVFDEFIDIDFIANEQTD